MFHRIPLQYQAVSGWFCIPIGWVYSMLNRITDHQLNQIDAN